MPLTLANSENDLAIKYDPSLTFVSKIYEQMITEIDPAYLIPPENLELVSLTSKAISEEGASLHSVSKIAAASNLIKFL